MRIRPAGPEDEDAAEALGQALAGLPLLQRYGTTPAGMGADLARLCRGVPGQRLLLAEEHDGAWRPCGMARFQVQGSLGAGGYLQLIALVPGHQGRGTGARLLDAVEDEVRAQSPVLFLLTSDFNHGAQRFYERQGYAQAGRLPDFARPGITELIYWKKLR